MATRTRAPDRAGSPLRRAKVRAFGTYGTVDNLTFMSDDLASDNNPKTYAPHDWFRDGQPVVIRFMPEYGTHVPLFPRSDFTDALVPEDLMSKLMRWHEVFLESFHWEDGWKSPDVRDRWAADAVPLAAELRQALAGKADLVVDLWPLPWSGPRP